MKEEDKKMALSFADDYEHLSSSNVDLMPYLEIWYWYFEDGKHINFSFKSIKAQYKSDKTKAFFFVRRTVQKIIDEYGDSLVSIDFKRL